jgi:hypothetical protein
MKEELEKQDEVGRATVEECMPYVMRRFDTNESNQNELMAGVRLIVERQGRVETIVNGFASGLRNAANVLANSNFESESVEAAVGINGNVNTTTTTTTGEGDLSRAMLPFGAGDGCMLDGKRKIRRHANSGWNSCL